MDTLHNFVIVLLLVLITQYPDDAMLARVLAMARCLSVYLSVCVCLSQVSVLSKRLNISGWFLVCDLPSTYHTLCCKEIQVPLKIRLLLSGTLLQTPDIPCESIGTIIVML